MAKFKDARKTGKMVKGRLRQREFTRKVYYPPGGVKKHDRVKEPGDVKNCMTLAQFMGKELDKMKRKTKIKMEQQFEDKIDIYVTVELHKIMDKYPNVLWVCRKFLKRGKWERFCGYLNEKNLQLVERCLAFTMQFKKLFEHDGAEQKTRSETVQEDILDSLPMHLHSITEKIKQKTDGMLASQSERTRVLKLMEQVNASMKAKQSGEDISQDNQQEWALSLLNCLWQPQDPVPNVNQLLSTKGSEKGCSDINDASSEDSTEDGEGADPR